MNIFAALTDNDFITAIAALIFWVGGYAAAPFIFIATLGVFRNLAGMSSGILRNARGKISNRANARLKADKAIRDGERQNRREFAALRSKYNWRNRKGIGAGEMEKVQRVSRGEWQQTEAAIIGTQIAQKDPSIQRGQALEAAAKIQASAGAVNAQQLYDKKFDELMKQTDKSYTPEAARKEATKFVTKLLTDALKTGTANQSQVTGTLIYLAQNKQIESINAIHETIATLSGKAGIRARQQYGSALGNSDAYSLLTGLNAGYGYNPEFGVNKETLQEKRAAAFLQSADVKIAGADQKAWAEAAQFDPELTAQRLATLYNAGGPVAANLQIPPLPDPVSENYASISKLHQLLKEKGVDPDKLRSPIESPPSQET